MGNEFYIFFEGLINAETTKRVIAAIGTAKGAGLKKITIFLSSWGGSIDNGFLLASVIQNSSIPISIHATNHIDSIANVIYVSAKERTAESYAKFYMHGASQSGSTDEKGLLETLSSVRTNNSRIAHFISENSKLQLNEVSGLMKAGQTLSAQEALKRGIIHQILHKEIPQNSIREDIIEI